MAIQIYIIPAVWTSTDHIFNCFATTVYWVPYQKHIGDCHIPLRIVSVSISVANFGELNNSIMVQIQSLQCRERSQHAEIKHPDTICFQHHWCQFRINCPIESIWYGLYNVLVKNQTGYYKLQLSNVGKQTQYIVFYRQYTECLKTRKITSWHKWDVVEI